MSRVSHSLRPGINELVPESTNSPCSHSLGRGAKHDKVQQDQNENTSWTSPGMHNAKPAAARDTASTQNTTVCLEEDSQWGSRRAALVDKLMTSMQTGIRVRVLVSLLRFDKL